MNERCETCRFFQDDNPGGGGMRTGLCRRHAPPAKLVAFEGERGTDKTDACWPNTDLSDWCGEWLYRKDSDLQGLHLAMHPPGSVPEKISKVLEYLVAIDYEPSKFTMHEVVTRIREMLGRDRAP